MESLEYVPIVQQKLSEYYVLDCMAKSCWSLSEAVCHKFDQDPRRLCYVDSDHWSVATTITLDTQPDKL